MSKRGGHARQAGAKERSGRTPDAVARDPREIAAGCHGGRERWPFRDVLHE